MSQFITVSKAAELLCSHALPPGEDRRAFRNKITERIKRKVASGKIRTPTGKRKVFANDLVHASDFAKVFDLIFSIRLPIRKEHEAVGIGSISIQGQSPTLVLSKDIEALYRRIAELEAEVNALKPDAEKYRRICEQNKNKAQGPRK